MKVVCLQDHSEPLSGSTGWQILPNPEMGGDCAGVSGGISKTPRSHTTGRSASQSALQHSPMMLPVDPPIPMLVAATPGKAEAPAEVIEEKARAGAAASNGLGNAEGVSMHAEKQHEIAEARRMPEPSDGVVYAQYLNTALDTHESEGSLMQEPSFITDRYLRPPRSGGYQSSSLNLVTEAAHPEGIASKRCAPGSLQSGSDLPSSIGSFAFSKDAVVYKGSQELSGGEGSPSSQSAPKLNDGVKFSNSPDGSMVELVAQTQPRIKTLSIRGGEAADALAGVAEGTTLNDTNVDCGSVTPHNDAVPCAATTVQPAAAPPSQPVDFLTGSEVVDDKLEPHPAGGQLLSVNEPAVPERRHQQPDQQEPLKYCTRDRVNSEVALPTSNSLVMPPTDAKSVKAPEAAEDSIYDSLDFPICVPMHPDTLPQPHGCNQCHQFQAGNPLFQQD